MRRRPALRLRSRAACAPASRSPLEPFARGASAAAPGTGVGLAIVAQQVALHGGTLRLEDSGLGGLGVHVALPATGGAGASGR